MKIKISKEINACRICGFKKIVPLISLGDLYISDFLGEKKNDSKINRAGRQPLEVVICDPDSGGCGLVQLKHTFSPELLYRSYWYRSGINKSMVEALSDIAQKTEKIAKPKSGDYVIDIGSNDATLFRFYKNKKLNLVGFEPAKNLIPYAKKNCPSGSYINEFFSFKAWQKRFDGKKAKIITAIAMFYDLDDPNEFVSNIAKCLDKKGVFVIQMSYLPSMLQQNAFDNICVKPNTIILGDNKSIGLVAAGDYAIGESGKLSEVKNIMQRLYQGNLVQIKPMYLESIVTTAEHPIRIVKKEHFRYECGQIKPKKGNYRLTWVPAKEVKRGDWIVVPKLKHGNIKKNLDLAEFNQLKNHHYRRGLLSLPLNKETAWLLGLYVAEGHIGGRLNNPYINFTLHKKETRFLKKITSLFKSLGYKTNTIFYNDRQSMEIRIVCAALSRAFLAWVGKGAVNKYIPDFIMFAPKKIKIAFLRGLFDGDGYIEGNKAHFHTSSKTLALQTQLLAASLGGMIGISYVKPYPKKIRGGVVKTKDSWQLRGSSKELAKIFGYQYQGNKINHVIVKDEYIFVPVKEVNYERYDGIVHNIETEDETYLVSNAIVHNCHEHVEYYSLASLGNLLKRHDLEIFDIGLNDVNGGSFRTYIQHKGYRAISDRVRKLEKFEKKLKLSSRKTYEAFVSKTLALRKKLYNFIKNENQKGKKTYVYGASTKGNVLLQFFNLNNQLIKAAADRNPDKWGKKTVGTLIPIISEEQARREKPDYFLILPWHFLKEFIQREKDYLRRGGKFIVPLPQFKIITKKDL